MRKPEFSLLRAPTWEIVEAGFEAKFVCSSVNLALPMPSFASLPFCWERLSGGFMFNQKQYLSASGLFFQMAALCYWLYFYVESGQINKCFWAVYHVDGIRLVAVGNVGSVNQDSYPDKLKSVLQSNM